MKSKVALCIPTYERYEVIKEFLTKCSSYYFKEGIDVYYYDSSESDDTERLINEWPEKEHLYYLRFPAKLGGDEKTCLIYQCYGLKKDYDFVWLSNDSLQIQPDSLHILMTNLLPEYDMVNITPQKQDYDHNGLRVFTNPEDYLWTCLYNVGRYGNAIVNKKTMLDGIDWDKYKYLFYDYNVQAFGNEIFYFIRLSELEKMRALFIPFFGSELRDSMLKKASNWRNDMFRICCESWVNAVNCLPDSFHNKREIALKFISTMYLHDFRDFRKYREEGIFDYKTYKKYEVYWNQVTTTPKWIIRLISLMPRKRASLVTKILVSYRKARFNRFLNSRPRIIIYGTSAGGFRYGKYLDEHNIPYDGFCCSKRADDENTYCGHPVYEFDELAEDLNNIGFVIAMQDENYERIKPQLVRLRCKFFRDGLFEGDFAYDMGYRSASWYIGKIR
jgi:hypothetical protein